jgi:hypothetical protein
MLRKIRTCVSAIVFLFNVVSATVLTFDDVPGANPNYKENVVPDGYGGLNWNNVNVVNTEMIKMPGSGYENGTVSGEWVAYNPWESICTINDDLFTFNGAYLTGAWNDELNIDVQGFKDGSLLFDKTVVVNTTAPSWCEFNFTDIDQLMFTSSGGTPHPGLGGSGTHFAMDNFTFNETQSVPEPSTIWLLLVGLFSMVGAVAKRNIKS